MGVSVEEKRLEQYKVKTLTHPVDWMVKVPGSKSITNRALLLAALSDGPVRLEGVLFSDDSGYFLGALRALGFDISEEADTKIVTVRGRGGIIPRKEAEIYVGSAGTAARFLTAMAGFSDGVYKVMASEQMKRRPMKPLFELLERAGASVTYLEQEGFLPVCIRGRDFDKMIGRELSAGNCPLELELDISRSTQFLSALLLTGPMIKQGFSVHITSEKTDGSYIRITRKMMQEFGVSVGFDGKSYTVGANTSCHRETYRIEPDVSAACYFYAAAALTGGTSVVENVHYDNSQGDLKFLEVLKQMGCAVEDLSEGICVRGPAEGRLHGVTVDMNDFSDQALTLAAIAPFADSKVKIANIAHIRKQESDRLSVIVTELTKLGVSCEESADSVVIHPSMPHAGVVSTYEDHRVAMAFSLIGLRVEGIVIDNPGCCAKTFAQYFEVLTKLCGE